MARLYLFPIAAVAAMTAASPAAACNSFSVYFDWGSAQVREDDAHALMAMTRTIGWKSGDIDRLLLVGHADTSGQSARNRALAAQRVQAVRDILVSLGVEEEVVVQRVEGEERPRVLTGQGVREEANRRVDIYVQLSAAAQRRQLREGLPLC